MDRRRILVISAVVVIVLTITGGSLLSLLNEEDTPGFLLHDQTFFRCKTAIDVEIRGLNESYFYGNPIEFIITITVSEPVIVDQVLIEVSTNAQTISKSVYENVGQLINKTLEFQVSLGISIWDEDNNDILVLSPGSYTLESIIFEYESCFLPFSYTESIAQQFTIYDYPVTETVNLLSWDKQNASNIIEQNQTSLVLNVTETFTMIENVTLTGIMNLILRIEGSFDHFNLSVGNDLLNYVPISNSSEVSVPVVQYTGTYQIEFTLYNVSSILSVSMNLPTKHKIITAVITENEWSPTYRASTYYLEQVNEHFRKTFNLTFAVAAVINFDYDGSNTLQEFIEASKLIAGERLGLKNDTWTHGPGKYRANKGIDILLTLTNKTMNYYGLVIGDTINGGYNLASHAGGSLNANGQRMSAAWGDNLLQHEISHIFNARDRWTNAVEPSVMTKPATLQDLLQDLVQGTLWLTLTNWVYDDLIRMVSGILKFSDYLD